MNLPEIKENETRQQYITRCLTDETLKTEYKTLKKLFSQVVAKYEVERPSDKKESSVELEKKDFTFELKAMNEEEGIFEGYASTFNGIDLGDDMILPGAFTKTIVEDFNDIKILYNHDQWDFLPIGKPLELREDEKGLYLRGKISDTVLGKDVKQLIKDGVLNKMSIGYTAVNREYIETDSFGTIRLLKEVKLFEVSVVVWPMNPEADITGIKNGNPTVLELKEKISKLEEKLNELVSEIKVKNEGQNDVKNNDDETTDLIHTEIKNLLKICEEVLGNGKQ